MKKNILRAFLSVTAASLLCMFAYIALNALWRAVLNQIENEVVNLTVLCTLTSAVYAAILTYLLKTRRSYGTEEVVADYKGEKYRSLFYDLKFVLRNERLIFIMISAVIFGSMLLNKLDVLIFGQKTVSAITLIWSMMCIYSAIFSAGWDIIGYFIGFAVIIFFYIIFVALHRRKQYRIWVKEKIE